MDHAHVVAAAEALAQESCLDPQVSASPLRGGLVSGAVQEIRVTYRGAGGARRTVRLVAKEVSGHAVRERWIYQHLDAWRAAAISPRLLAVEELSGDRAVLYLEAVRRTRAWPWHETRAVARVLERLAAVHETTGGAELPRPARWDYDAELAEEAPRTVEVLERAARETGVSALGRAVPAARRVALALPAMRGQLAAFAPLGTALLHGDVHSGNVLLRRQRGGEEPVLIDWGRARTGSPLEDVSSWLHSLRTWEPEARRRHDSLVGAYLSRRGMERRLTSDLRDAYWLAGASNAMAGALTYQLLAADEAPPGRRRDAAVAAAVDWLRVIRRADASWS